jgi:hypothetical protein
MKKKREDQNLSFDRYILEKRFPVDYPKYTDPHDSMQVIVDEILYYERLVDDLARVFKHIGIPFDGSLGVNAKSEYRTDSRHYRDVYSPKQAAIVGSAFKQELLLHGYTF